MKTLGLVFICRNQTDELRRMLESVRALRPDQICAGWNGDSPETLAILEEFGCEVHRWQWNDNFSDARNHIYSKCTCDYAMYFDSDEELLDAAVLRNYFDTDPEFNKLFIYLDYFRGQQVYWKLRVVKTGIYQCEGALHDEFVPIGTEPPGKNIFLDGCLVKHHYVPSSDRGARNLRVTRQEYERIGTSKSAYDYGLTLYESGHAAECMPLLHRVAVDSSMADCYRMNGYRMLSAICITRRHTQLLRHYARRMIELCPEKPDGYFRLAAAYYLRREWTAAIRWTEAGFNRDYCADGMPVPYAEYSLIPAKLYAAALFQLELLQPALRVIDQTLLTYPDDPWMLSMRDRVGRGIIDRQWEAVSG